MYSKTFQRLVDDANLSFHIEGNGSERKSYNHIHPLGRKSYVWHSVYKAEIGRPGTVRPVRYTVGEGARKMHGADWLPSIYDIVYALRVDASCFVDAFDLEDFIANFGGDAKTFRACAKHDKMLRHMFPSSYDFLMSIDPEDEDEDENDA